MNERDEQDFINIAILENVIEAQLITSILDEHEIPPRIRSFHDTAYDGVCQFHMGWGALFAPLSNKEKILEILNDIRSKIFDNQE